MKVRKHKGEKKEVIAQMKRLRDEMTRSMFDTSEGLVEVEKLKEDQARRSIAIQLCLQYSGRQK